MNRILLSLLIALSLFAALLPIRVTAQTPVTTQLYVGGWNLESGGSDPATIVDQIAAFDGVDLWGMSEGDADDVARFETGAEIGEGADFARLLSSTGGGDRLLALYDTSRFILVDSDELEDINVGGNVRAPLVLTLEERDTGLQFLFMVNHLYRTDDAARHTQAALLNQWAAEQTLPVIAVGDYNFDWDVATGAHDVGYDLMVQGERWEWIRPATLVPTQCSGWPCEFESVLDFVFVAGPAREWPASAAIIVRPGDFPDDESTSDHRPVQAEIQTVVSGTVTPMPPGPTATPVPDATRSMLASYTVVKGDTLYSIARRYGVSVDELKRLNQLTYEVIYVGQVLLIDSAPTGATGDTVHIVIRGDTLYSLARRYQTTVEAILETNGLSGTNIYVGQRLLIAATSVSVAGHRFHRVDKGDTLYSIARQYGTTVEAVMTANALSSTWIYVGQRLRIPVTKATPAPKTTARATVTATSTRTATPTVTATATPTPTMTSTPITGCDPAYPTVCIPSPPPDLDCDEIPYTDFTVLAPDPHGFDGDEDGIGCES